MKILIFTKYSIKGASSRYRSYQYIPYLEQNNIKVKTSSLFNNEYLNKRYNMKNVSYFYLTKLFFNRVFQLFKVYRYDMIVIEKELFPFIPPLFELLLRIFNIKYILDYDDAIFHLYDENKNKIISFLFKSKISKIIAWSNGVITGSPYLTKFAKQYHTNILEIPTVVDIKKYKNCKTQNDSEFIIGWIGTPITSKYVANIFPAIKKFISKYTCRLLFVGFDHALIPDDLKEKIDVIEWKESTEIKFISTFSVGIMPLDDEKWARGKCGLKLIQYMACKKPVITTPVGVNTKIVEPEINGFWANNENDWYIALEKLYKNPVLRTIMGENNFSKVEKNYSIQNTNIMYSQFIINTVLS